MNLKELVQEHRKAFNDPKVQEAWEESKPHLGAIIMAVVLLNKARRKRKQGDMVSAIYYAILWLGVTNNSNHTFAARQAKKLAQRSETVRYPHLLN